MAPRSETNHFGCFARAWAHRTSVDAATTTSRAMSVHADVSELTAFSGSETTLGAVRTSLEIFKRLTRGYPSPDFLLRFWDGSTFPRSFGRRGGCSGPA